MSSNRRPGRPPGKRSDETRARLIRAARRRFAEAGYAGTSNKAVAAEAGVTAAAIYNYFPSKLALFLAVSEHAFAVLLPRYQQSMGDDSSLRGAVAAVLRASVAIHREEPSLAAFLATLPMEIERVPELRAAFAHLREGMVQLMEGAVDEAIGRGEVQPGVPRGAVVSMLMASLMGMSQLAAIDSEQLPGAVEAYLALLDGALLVDREL